MLTDNTITKCASELMVDVPGDKGAKLAKAVRGRKKALPASNEDPMAELRALVAQHKALTKKQVALTNMAADKVVRKDSGSRKKGDVLKCELPDDVQQSMHGLSAVMKARADELQGAMRRELKKIPIFTTFLSKVFGLQSGSVICAYLVTELDPRDPVDRETGEIIKARKSSAFRQFCGMAVQNGRLSRHTRGRAGEKADKSHFSGEMRTRLYQLFQSIWKNGAKFTVCAEHAETKPEKRKTDEQKAAYASWRAETLSCSECAATSAPHGKSSKYLKIWTDYKHRMLQSERCTFNPKTKRLEVVRIGAATADVLSAAAFAHSTGWHKAADVFLEDLYVVWRALEGLPVWPSYYAAKLGYEHGGKICVNAPKMLTVDDALATVGDVGGFAVMGGVVDSVEDDEEDEAAE